ncbi:unnamed protein product [Cylicocyclus nassatus]|uniref:Peptidase S1 domain-containing protein n=1 Tax=Cylicocyclus nassatus TaxID=53992 RepID=A0AA36GRY2_CYLNA|nr:unnamed protein product [Cylicocyclus nassatus]
MQITAFCLAYLIANVICKKLTEKENEELRENCGKLRRRASYKILQGRPVERDEYPFFVTLRYHKGLGAELCGGSLISPYHVLTAAHCIMESEHFDTKKVQCVKPREYRKFNYTYYTLLSSWRIYIGSACRLITKCRESKKIDRIYVRTDYDKCSHVHDIAIITLSSKIERDEGIPICLPQRKQLLRLIMEAVGSGIDPSRRNIWSGGIQKTYLFRSNEKDFIIETVDKVSALCSGDSGGPLFSSYKDRFVQLGIASSVKPPCSESNGYLENRYVDVRMYLDWICTHTGICPKKDVDEDEDDD